jgi:tetratricopeptide (TPR) repeat protein
MLKFITDEQARRSSDRASRDQQRELVKPRDSLGRQRLQLALEPLGQVAAFHDQIVANSLTDIIAKTISELGTIEVLDFRNGGGDGQRPASEHALALQAGVASDTGGTTWRVVLANAAERRVLWSTGSRQEGGKLDIGDPVLLREMNQIVEAALSSFMTTLDAGAEQRIASLLCQRGIQHLLKLGRDNMVVADQLFARAFEMEPRGIYLAWRAYLRTYLLAERLTNDRQVASDEALAFMRQALEMEPRNSFVASFSAHVHSIVRRSYVAAYELAQRSIQLNRANPMGWVCLGIAECHLGKATAGFEHALIARELAGTTPLRFHVDGLACLAASMAGDVDRSIWLGEACHALAPTFKPPLRYLSALYLLRDEEQASQEMVRRLKAVEPEFSYEMLQEASYPAASLRRSKLLERLPSRQI